MARLRKEQADEEEQLLELITKEEEEKVEHEQRGIRDMLQQHILVQEQVRTLENALLNHQASYEKATQELQAQHSIQIKELLAELTLQRGIEVAALVERHITQTEMLLNVNDNTLKNSVAAIEEDDQLKDELISERVRKEVELDVEMKNAEAILSLTGANNSF